MAIHLKGRPRCPLMCNVFSASKKFRAQHACVPSFEETVLGPVSLKERGDRRRPRCSEVLTHYGSVCNIAEHVADGSLAAVQVMSASE